MNEQEEYYILIFLPFRNCVSAKNEFINMHYDVSSEQREMFGSDPEIQEGAEQAIKNVRWLSLDEFTERERAYFWSYGLLDIEDFYEKGLTFLFLLVYFPSLVHIL